MVGMRLLVLAAALMPSVLVSAKDWKTCSESSHCVRNRAIADSGSAATSPYAVDSSIDFDQESGEITGKIGNSASKTKLSFKLTFLTNDAARIIIDEHDGLHNRYHEAPKFAFHRALPVTSDVKREDSSNTITFSHGLNEVVIQKQPFAIKGRRNGKEVINVNGNGWFNFEQYRKKRPDEDWSESLLVDDWLNKRDFTWIDTRPKGPASVAADITFPGFEHVYGIPEHATSLNLKTTRGPGAAYTEPFRFWNTDTYNYTTNVTTANYGAIPFMVAAKPGSAAGVMWLNPSEAWIDIYRKEGSTTSHWMSESGLVDLLFFWGNDALEVSRNFGILTGSQELPQRFSLGYHQCRYSYLTETEALEVDAGFDEYKIPYDTLWLDIDVTQGKRYFTWNYTAFPTPVRMQDILAAKGRKMVTIKDPHLAVDENYKVYTQALEQDLLIKFANGSTYEGQCWPTNIPVEQGKTLAVWPDYTKPEMMKFWAEQYKYENYENQTKILWTWNDMNEPAVFGGPDKSAPRDTLHYGDVEHRDVHNLYGALMIQASYEGHLLRDDHALRPFILTRAFFAGSQRYGAMWMGDSGSTWEHLQVASPTIQSLALSGFQFTGGDIGGFIGSPDGELLTRWYYSAIFTGFYRGHSDLGSPRREPWVRGEPYTSYIREAIRTRYTLLPFIYTSFWNNYVSPEPIVRPMFAAFPNDPKTLDMEEQYFFGRELMVKPITSPNVTETSIYLPDAEPYYNIFTWEKLQGQGEHTVAAGLNGLPAFIRGGSVVPTKHGVATGSSKTQESLPLDLVAVLSAEGSASGSMYHDDGESFSNQKGKFIWKQFIVKSDKITSRDMLAGKNNVHTNGAGDIPFSPYNAFQKWSPLKVKYITLLGAKAIKSATLNVKSKNGCHPAKEVKIIVDGCKTKLEVNVRLGDDWDVVLHY
ncbi:putative alpha glucosidase II, alpha subunit [Powellomyces hirtus]|nr:putative alpha glucosidase II, alpha subunit [Powellomyces hirtus]